MGKPTPPATTLGTVGNTLKSPQSKTESAKYNTTSTKGDTPAHTNSKNSKNSKTKGGNKCTKVEENMVADERYYNENFGNIIYDSHTTMEYTNIEEIVDQKKEKEAEINRLKYILSKVIK